MKTYYEKIDVKDGLPKDKGTYWVEKKFWPDGHFKISQSYFDGVSFGSDYVTSYLVPVSERAVEERAIEIGFSGTSLLHDLLQVGNIQNEDGMPVIKFVDKPNGGSVAYVRHDAMVKRLNTLVNEYKALFQQQQS